MRGDWRISALGGLSAGLALSPLLPSAGGDGILLALGALLLATVLLRPCGARGHVVWLALVCLGAALAGLLAGAARIRAIDAGAFGGRPGSRVSVTGNVVAVARRSDGEVHVAVETPEGRLLIWAPEPVPDLEIGAGVRASGRLARPPDYYRATLRRQGVSTVLRTGRVEPTGATRGGLAGRLDAIRSRAEDGLGEGMPEREAALARGFVLGQDDRIDPATIADFRRSGLAHLLAVSGQNVVLLALLAIPFLATLGIPLRARLLWTCALIAAYVPLAGGGPSIQRAGVMGAAGIVATVAGRPASRAYALLLAVAVTLALNPLASGDAGWQLSFAAVAGIFLLAAPLRARLAALLGPGGWRRAVCEGAAVTIAATIATAPLMANHFGTLSVASLAANLLVLPAVAPAMWLGMLTAAAAQVPGVPLAPLNAIDSLLLGFIAQVAAWFGRPHWAVVDLTLAGPLQVAAAYAVLLAGTALALHGLARFAPRRRSARRRPVASLAALAAALAAALWPGGGGAAADGPSRGLRVEVLDVGQGDAILLQPARSPAVLVDGGPHGNGIAEKLRSAGVASLGAAIVTHDQSDHAGGIRELLGTLPVHRLVYAAAGRGLLRRAALAGATPYRVAEGSQIRSGALRLEVLWPPRSPLDRPPPGTDPNLSSLVLLVRWHSFSMLLTGDAEAESVPIDPGPIDVLKVSHHGSEDAGLGPLLALTVPQFAVISVGESNPFGHPTPATLGALAEHRVTALRTDRDGTIVIEAGRRGFAVSDDG
ncbi:MAG: ComEC/Rec2 family competence protein [Solirubrobacterales bacterium]